jgi:arginase
VSVAVPEAIDIGSPTARYLDAIKRACENVASLVGEADRNGFVPLVLGGDHSIAIGTLGGMARSRGPGAALWIDAHGDLNRPETSPSGNVHGMPLAAAMGAAGDTFDSGAWPTPSIERAALVGVRSLDAGERALIAEIDVRVYTMSDLDRLGTERVVREALAFLAGASFLHVSFDLDAVDPMFAPGVGTPVSGGLSYREAHLALELVSETGLLDSLELVEVNPILDQQNTTGALAVELAASALGARIL